MKMVILYLLKIKMEAFGHKIMSLLSIKNKIGHIESCNIWKSIWILCSTNDFFSIKYMDTVSLRVYSYTNSFIIHDAIVFERKMTIRGCHIHVFIPFNQLGYQTIYKAYILKIYSANSLAQHRRFLF